MTQAIAAALSGLNTADEAAAMINGNIGGNDKYGSSSGRTALHGRAATDIAIYGTGMFIVTDHNQGISDNAAAFSKAVSLRTDINGNAVFLPEYALYEWQIDENYQLPTVRTITESFVSINIQKLVLELFATCRIIDSFIDLEWLMKDQAIMLEGMEGCEECFDKPDLINNEL